MGEEFDHRCQELNMGKMFVYNLVSVMKDTVLKLEGIEDSHKKKPGIQEISLEGRLL